MKLKAKDKANGRRNNRINYTMYLSGSLLKEPIVSGSGYLSTSPDLA